MGKGSLLLVAVELFYGEEEWLGVASVLFPHNSPTTDFLIAGTNTLSTQCSIPSRIQNHIYLETLFILTSRHRQRIDMVATFIDSGIALFKWTLRFQISLVLLSGILTSISCLIIILTNTPYLHRDRTQSMLTVVSLVQLPT